MCSASHRRPTDGRTHIPSLANPVQHSIDRRIGDSWVTVALFPPLCRAPLDDGETIQRADGLPAAVPRHSVDQPNRSSSLMAGLPRSLLLGIPKGTLACIRRRRSPARCPRYADEPGSAPLACPQHHRGGWWNVRGIRWGASRDSRHGVRQMPTSPATDRQVRPLISFA